MINSVCVYCGSREGSNLKYRSEAVLLGKSLARENIELVYGGGGIGLMGILANAVLDNGGVVRGVFPSALEAKEFAHPELTEIIHVGSMHERKSKMMELAEAFVVLPGGIGTMEEFFEVWTWNQIGILQKPVVLINVDNYYEKLIDFIEKMFTDGFISARHRDLLLIEETSDRALKRILECGKGIA